MRNLFLSLLAVLALSLSAVSQTPIQDVPLTPEQFGFTANFPSTPEQSTGYKKNDDGTVVFTSHGFISATDEVYFAVYVAEYPAAITDANKELDRVTGTMLASFGGEGEVTGQKEDLTTYKFPSRFLSVKFPLVNASGAAVIIVKDQYAYLVIALVRDRVLAEHLTEATAFCELV